MEKKSIRRRTQQRALVLEAVCRGNHPTAKEIYDDISRTETISVGTVYRNLFVLEEEGEILPVACTSEVMRYDRRRDPHYHFCCRVCGRVFDLTLPYAGAWDRQVAQESGFAIRSHRVIFDGICSECLE